MLQRGAAFALFLLLAGCGGGDYTPPGAPATASPGSPTPTPSPAATSAGYLHVLQHPWVMTYEIDPSGRLRPPVTQRISKDLKLLADEPQGRFVYAARGGWRQDQLGVYEQSDLAIVTYVPDARDGTLSQVSEITVAQPRRDCGCYDAGHWENLQGGANRVHARWFHGYGIPGHNYEFSYVSVAVAGDGRLGPVGRPPSWYHPDLAEILVDVRANVLYKGGTSYSPLEANVIESDGTLNRIGRTSLCLATTMHPYDTYDLVTPLATARGFLFTSFANSDYGVPMVCAYQGPGLKPLYAIDMPADVADAFVPSFPDEPVLVAMGLRTWTGRDYRSELRVFSMNSEGALRQTYAQDVPDHIEKLLFHPSGRSLYTVDHIGGLRVYTIGPEGRLELAMHIEHAGGSMAITLKDAQPGAQDTGQ
jgi:hypothetical protein